jgi:hypothetical protein
MASDSTPLTEVEVQAEMQVMDAAAISDVNTDDDDSMVSTASDIDEYENTAWPAQTDAPRTFDVDRSSSYHVNYDFCRRDYDRT